MSEGEHDAAISKLFDSSRSSKMILEQLLKHHKKIGNQAGVEAAQDAIDHLQTFDMCVCDIH